MSLIAWIAGLFGNKMVKTTNVIDTIEGCPITRTVFTDGSEVVEYTAFGREDNDGTGPSHGDPCHQDDTSLHVNGRPLNADVDKYLVVPPQIIKGTTGKVYGSLVYVTIEGVTKPGVVGDGGPEDRLGEMSDAYLEDFGISDNPISGGVNSKTVHVKIMVGVPAPGYELQAA